MWYAEHAPARKLASSTAPIQANSYVRLEYRMHSLSSSFSSFSLSIFQSLILYFSLQHDMTILLSAVSIIKQAI